MTEISSGAFGNCTGLTAINVAGNPNYEFDNDNGVLFRKNFEVDSTTGEETDTPDGTLTLHTYLAGNAASEYTIPEGVTAIEDSAFLSAAHLTAITLPASLVEINPSYCGFESCEKLINIYVSEDSTTYTSIDGVVFNKGKTTLICYPPNRTDSSYTIPNSVTTIGENAFQNAAALTSITIPNSVTAIGRAAFTNSGLTEITIPADVENLGYNAAAPAYYFDGSAFEGTSVLTKFNVAEGNTTYLSIDGVLFKINAAASGESSTVSTAAITAESGEGGTEPVELTLIRYPGAKANLLYTIPSQDDNDVPVMVTAIEQRSFESSMYLTSVSIPASVKTIGYRAFNASMNLVSVFLPNSVEKIGALAFEGCFVLKDVYYAGSVDKWQALPVTEWDLCFSTSDLDELGIIPSGDEGWTPRLTNNFLLLGIEKYDTIFKRTFLPTFHYESDGTVTITLNPNGGTLAEGTQTSWPTEHFQPSSYTPPTPNRSGYSFAGWTCTTKVFDWECREYLTVTRVWSWDDPVYADMELTASWSRNSTSYSVTLPGTIENGAVKSSHRHAEKGELVTLTVTPDRGYTLETLTITDKKGNAVELTDNGDGTYSFKMPAGKVSIEATFMEDNSMLNFFTDVTADKYYYDAVLWAARNGITGGIGNDLFGPDLTCTRAQIVTFLYRAAVAQGMDVSVGEDTNILSYTDALEVPEYAFAAFQWAVGAGIVQGADGALMPNDNCTRAQIVTMLFRYAAANGMEAVTLQELVSGYGDAAQVPGYALPAFNWALAQGIVQGYNGNLMPSSDCTRAQIVTMLYRLLGTN